MKSNSRCAKTRADESVRFREFMRIEAGTSCAIATRASNKMMVANISSRMLKPRSLVRRFVNAESITVRQFSCPTKRIVAKVRLEDRSTFAWRPKEARSPRDSQTPDRPRFRNKTQRLWALRSRRRESHHVHHTGPWHY